VFLIYQRTRALIASGGVYTLLTVLQTVLAGKQVRRVGSSRTNGFTFIGVKVLLTLAVGAGIGVKRITLVTVGGRTDCANSIDINKASSTVSDAGGSFNHVIRIALHTSELIKARFASHSTFIANFTVLEVIIWAVIKTVSI
jgi:hypothetical protein